MKNITIATVCCITLLASCQQAEEIMTSGKELVMSVEASIGETDVVSGRYAGDTPNDVNFAGGDLIGLSMNEGDFVEWEYEGDKWQRADGNIAYWNEKDKEHTFWAFYPFDEVTSEGVITMPELMGQDGTMASVAKCDFLIATIKESYTTSDGVVSLVFNHVSSLVTIRLKGEGDLGGATISKITITGDKILSKSTYSFGDENHVTIANEDLDTMVLELKDCVITKGENQEFYFIFNSGTVNLSDVTLVIEYSSNETDYTATLQGLGSNQEKFISGEQHIFSLKIADGVLSITGNQITDWSGSESMDDIIINGIENNADEND